MPFALRSLELGDAPSVHAIASVPSVARRLGGTPLDGVETWRARIQDLDSSRSLMIGAFEGGGLCGFAMLDGSPSVRQRHVASLALAVHPDHHRRGIGDQLISTLIESAERWYGFLRIELGVHAENTAAIALYEKHGFSIETRRRKDMLVDAGRGARNGAGSPRLGVAARPRCTARRKSRRASSRGHRPRAHGRRCGGVRPPPSDGLGDGGHLPAALSERGPLEEALREHTAGLARLGGGDRGRGRRGHGPLSDRQEPADAPRGGLRHVGRSR